MAATARRRVLNGQQINLTPLLDCILNLIFFFLLATTLKEDTTVMEVRLPQSGIEAPAPPSRQEWVVTLGPKGELFLNDDAVTSGELRMRLSAAAKMPGQPLPVRVRSDRATPMQEFVTVMTICSETGHPTVGVQVKSEPSLP